ncbi:hypothetical protein ABZ093_06690 [Streptomyces cyaneofuscatus]|uniref:hypothetical protein n=1 Tax=Streptomyces cyaneofuscatus TaxID=66883 RepID=UPI0033A7C18C
MHRTVMSGFPGWVDDGSRDARAQMGILSTWTLNLREAQLSLVVQSQVPGDWGRVPRAALAEEPETLTLDRTFSVGETVDSAAGGSTCRLRARVHSRRETGRYRRARANSCARKS